MFGKRKRALDDGMTPGERAVQKARDLQAAKPRVVVKTYTSDKHLAKGIATMERAGYRIMDRTAATPHKHQVHHTVRFEKKGR